MTPLQIGILLKLFYLATPDDAYNHGILPEVEFIDHLANLGIVIQAPSGSIIAVDRKPLEMYVAKVTKIPLPKRTWIY